MRDPLIISVPVAGIIPFDNSTNGMTSEEVQSAIEETWTSISGVADNTFTRSGSVGSGTWLLIGGNVSNKSGWVIGGSGMKIKKITCGSEDADTYVIGVYVHDGNSINLTQLGTVSVSASRQSIFIGNLPFTAPKHIALKVESGSAKNLNVSCVVGVT